MVKFIASIGKIGLDTEGCYFRMKAVEQSHAVQRLSLRHHSLMTFAHLHIHFFNRQIILQIILFIGFSSR
jgi:hypothetical protein